MAKGVNKGTRMLTGAVRPGFWLARVQTERVEVSTVGVMTDMTNVQVVRKTTYASVASQVDQEVVAGPVWVDVEMGGMGGCPVGTPLALVGGVVPVPGVVQAQALLVHVVDCRRSVRALLAAARGLRVGEYSVRGVRWLLGVAGVGASACLRWLYTWITQWWCGDILCGLGGLFTLWSVMSLRGDCGVSLSLWVWFFY